MIAKLHKSHEIIEPVIEISFLHSVCRLLKKQTNIDSVLCHSKLVQFGLHFKSYVRICIKVYTPYRRTPYRRTWTTLVALNLYKESHVSSLYEHDNKTPGYWQI